MANTPISYGEIRFDVRDPNQTHVYIFIRDVDGSFPIIRGWRYKAFPATMSTLDIMQAWANGQEEPMMWPMKAPDMRPIPYDIPDVPGIKALMDTLTDGATIENYAQFLREQANTTMNNPSMPTYIGTKIISAKPMNRADYNAYCGWQLPANENGEDEGYLVEYNDGGKPNHPAHTGYISWSPKEQFEGAYRQTTGLTFGLALDALKAGKKVARAGWNGKGMWLVLVPGTPEAKLREGTPYANALGLDSCEILPHIDMWTINAHGRRAMLPGWVASQTDMLAEDWMIVD